jgi:oligopeptide/dipeptide ABC transporter ATP-binding protein
MVMYRGRVMEEAPTESLVRNPVHPYTRALFSALPKGRPGEPRERIRLKGELPSATAELPGCPFASRCPQAQQECSVKVPKLEEKPGGHRAACLFV